MSYDLLRFSLLFRRFVIVKEHSVRPLFQERASHDSSFTTPPQSIPRKRGCCESPTRGFAKKSRAPICAGFPTLLSLATEGSTSPKASHQSVRVSHLARTRAPGPEIHHAAGLVRVWSPSPSPPRSCKNICAGLARAARHIIALHPPTRFPNPPPHAPRRLLVPRRLRCSKLVRTARG